MIEMLHVAPLATVQDLGRFGQRHHGIGQAGAMDPVAARQANLLVGNSPDQALLEFSHGPIRLRLSDSRLIALMGADYQAYWQHPGDAAINPLPPGIARRLPAGALLTLAQPRHPGLRAYLAVAGGIAVAKLLGSRSTDLNAGFGGHEGRTLRGGDRLPLGSADASVAGSRTGIRPLPRGTYLRAITGPDYRLFDRPSQASFWHHRWLVSKYSNRMGLRLQGPSVAPPSMAELLSFPVLPGVIQVPGDGQPIILGNDAQTTGGYAHIATIIEADRWRLAYLLPGDRIQLQLVSFEAALLANRRLQRFLQLQAHNLREFQTL